MEGAYSVAPAKTTSFAAFRGRFCTLYAALTLLGVALLLLWGSWWTENILTNRMNEAQYTWVPAWPYLGLDFLNPYFAARHWAAGGNPYTEPFGDPNGRRFCYPPHVLPCFAW